MREIDLQRQVIDYLLYFENQGRLFFTRINTIGVFDGTNFRRLARGTKRGIADILILANRKTIWMELKSAKGRQSIYQKDFQLAVENHGGGYYYVVRDFENAKNIIDYFVFSSSSVRRGRKNKDDKAVH